jgi:hypothetical protein
LSKLSIRNLEGEWRKAGRIMFSCEIFRFQNKLRNILDARDVSEGNWDMRSFVCLFFIVLESLVFAALCSFLTIILLAAEFELQSVITKEVSIKEMMKAPLS